MNKQHNYKSTIEWTGNIGKGTEGYNSYQRSYTIQIEDKEIILGSSDPAFLGDKTKHNGCISLFRMYSVNLSNQTYI